MGKGKLGALLAGLALTATLGMAQVTVVGTNTYPTDVNNVQAAVMVPGATVFLKGIFNFGDPDDPGACGQAVLSAPGVTLRGCPGATIRGGYFPLTTVAVPGGTGPATAKNLTIRDIRFEGWGGYAIYHTEVQAEDNVTRIEGNTLVNTRWPADDPPCLGIHYCTGGGKAFIRKNRIIGASLFAISAHDLTLHKDDWLIIEGNRIEDAHLDPLVVETFNPAEGDPDHGPVIIRNNRIGISADTPNPFVWGISLGTFYFGCALNNAQVEGNVITGRVCDGIVMFPYGHDMKIVNNDLSGATAFECQIVGEGRRNLISGNRLGPVETTGEYGNPISWGIGLLGLDWSEWYPQGVGPDPDPVSKNVLIGNDFRRTGLAGWAVDGACQITSMGCVLLLSAVDMGWNEYWPGAEVTGNLIMEFGKFPAGTGGPAKQVLEYPIYAHDNWIFGQPIPWAPPLAAASPRSSLTVKTAGQAYAEGLAKKRAFIEKAKKGTERK